MAPDGAKIPQIFAQIALCSPQTARSTFALDGPARTLEVNKNTWAIVERRFYGAQSETRANFEQFYRHWAIVERWFHEEQSETRANFFQLCFIFCVQVETLSARSVPRKQLAQLSLKVIMERVDSSRSVEKIVPILSNLLLK